MVGIFREYFAQLRELDILTLVFEEEQPEEGDFLFFTFAGVQYCLRLDYPLNAKDDLAKLQLFERDFPSDEYRHVRELTVECGGEIPELVGGSLPPTLRSAGERVFYYLMTGNKK